MSTIDERMTAVLTARSHHIASCQAYSDATRAVSSTRIALADATNELHTAESALRRAMIEAIGEPVRKPIRRVTLSTASYSKLDVHSL